MRLTLPALAVALAIHATTLAPRAQRPQAERPSFTGASTELVVLPVTVTDRRGRLMPGLPRERFTVFDDGRPQEIALFSGEDTPVSIALVIDDSGSMRGKLGPVLAATILLARWSHPEDEIFVFEFNDTVRDALKGGRVEARNEAELEAALRTLVPQGQTALYDALLRSLERLDGATHARKALVLMSDGGDNASKATLEDVLERAQRSNVTIYAIGMFDPDATDTNPGVLKKLAAATDGDRFLARSPARLIQACRGIAEEIRSGYTLGYVPPRRDGRFHAVRVQVAGPDGRQLVGRTRPGYFAAKPVVE